MPKQKQRKRMRSLRRRTGRIDQNLRFEQYLDYEVMNPGAANRQTVTGSINFLQVFQGLAITDGMTLDMKDMSIDIQAHSASFFSLTPFILKDLSSSTHTLVTNGTDNGLLEGANAYTDSEFRIKRLTNEPLVAHMTSYAGEGNNTFYVHKKIHIPRDVLDLLTKECRDPSTSNQYVLVFHAVNHLDSDVMVYALCTMKYTQKALGF